MIAVATLFTGEQGLLGTIFSTDMPADRARLRGVARINGDHLTTTPALFVFQHAPEHPPTLIENRLVQSRLRRNVLPWLLDGALCRCRHVLDLQVFDDDDRVVFADRCRVLMQEIMPTVGNRGVDTIDAGFLLLPVL